MSAKSVKLSSEPVAPTQDYMDKTAIDRIAAQNPDLPRDFIEGTLLARKEADDGLVTPFEFD